ncbi:P-loop containing nucleoside triphosphate hydrolase protein, partial [Mycena rebaudengoi]
NSYHNSDFLIPDDMETPADVKKGFLYTDDIKDSRKLVDHLNSRVKSTYCNYGLVCPYNAGMSRQYRADMMALFKAGIVHILVCTNVAGMGCDIPNIELMVQWKTPKTLSLWIQRAGCAARCDGGTKGLAVMIVEKSAFKINPLDQSPVDNAPSPSAPGRRGRGSGRGGAKQGKDYVVRHGQQRGFHWADNDHMSLLNPLEVVEGLYMLIQATTCCRVVLTKIIKNSMPNVPSHRCCDICNPKLFNQVCPPKPVKAARQKGIRKGPPIAPHAILDDDSCELTPSLDRPNRIY